MFVDPGALDLFRVGRELRVQSDENGPICFHGDVL